MAYYNGMPYIQQAYPQYYPQYNTIQQQGNQTPQQGTQNVQQIQNGGFISVPNIEVARNYHVAPGTSITFIDENAPYVYTKTRGFSQFDQPVFEKLKLVKEEDTPQSPQEAFKGALNEKPMNDAEYATKDEIKALRDDYEGLLKEVNKLKESMVTNDDE